VIGAKVDPKLSASTHVTTRKHKKQELRKMLDPAIGKS
jgi:hypothetical protein